MSWRNGNRSWTTPLLYSVLLHLLIAAPLFLQMPRKVTPSVNRPAPNPIQAEVVDAGEVEKTLKELKLQDQQKLQADKKRREALEETERKLKQAKSNLDDAKKKKEAEEKKALAAQKARQAEEKMAELAKSKAAQAKAEQAKAAQAEKKRLAAEKTAKEAELAKEKAELKRQQAIIEEARRLKEQQEALAQKKRQDEQARLLQQEEAQRQQQLAAEQASLDRDEINRYLALIKNRVSANWRQPPNWAEGNSCDVSVKLIPGGEVIEARVTKSCGNPALNLSVERAVLSASPLPVPSGLLFNQQFRNFTFVFRAK